MGVPVRATSTDDVDDDVPRSRTTRLHSPHRHSRQRGATASRQPRPPGRSPEPHAESHRMPSPIACRVGGVHGRARGRIGYLCPLCRNPKTPSIPPFLHHHPPSSIGTPCTLAPRRACAATRVTRRHTLRSAPSGQAMLPAGWRHSMRPSTSGQMPPRSGSAAERRLEQIASPGDACAPRLTMGLTGVARGVPSTPP